MSDFVTNDALGEIKERLSIASLVERYVSLTKSGAQLKGLCPFHDDTNPSLQVNDNKGLFHCFSCGAGGDIFGFYMKYNNVPFAEALEELAKLAGVTLTHFKTDRKVVSKKNSLYKINSIAAEYYHDFLINSAGGKPSRRYLKERGVLEEAQRAFKLGAAPDSWSALRDELRKRKIEVPALEELGLVIARKSGDGHYDRFRNRIIFPIQDVEGRVIGFGGRALSGEEPKYLNSPESVIYKKSTSLYGLNHARDEIRRSGKVIVVEGYMDVLSLWESGVRNAVASLGTSFSERHAAALKRFTNDVVVVFDCDRAGVKAAMRALGALLKADMFPRIAVLPEGEDPDSFIRRFSRDDFLGLVDNAVPLLDYYLDDLLKRLGDNELKLAEATQMASQALGLVINPIERNYHVKRFAEALGLREGDLISLLSKNTQAKSHPIRITKQSAPSRETLVLKVLLKYPDLAEGNVDRAFLEYLTDADTKEVLNEVVTNGCHEVSTLLTRFNESHRAQELISHAVFNSEEIPTRESALNNLADCLNQIEQYGLGLRLKRLRQEIERARRANDDELQRLLIAQHRDLEKARENLKRRTL